MKNKTKRVFWGFFSLDYKAMETYLEEMAEKGWMLEKIGRYIAKFRAIEPQNHKFYVDVFKEGGTLTPDNNKELVEYRKLCQESGWTFITSQEYLQFFYADGDSEPVPIQTDEEIEQKIVEHTLLRREMLNMLIVLVASIIVFISHFPIRYNSLLSFVGVTTTFLFPIFFIFTAISAVYSIIWMIKARKNIKNGLSIVKPTLKSARRRIFAFNGSSLIFLMLFILAMAADTFFEPEKLTILLGLVVGAIVGTGIRNSVKKNKIKKGKIGSYTMVALIMVVILIRTAGTFITEKSEDMRKVDYVPEEYSIISLKEISKESGGSVSREFKPGMSPLVPKHYTYWEYENLKGSAISINIKYYEAINPYFAGIIFDGITDRFEKGFKFMGAMVIAPKKIIKDDEMKKSWDVDIMALTEEQDQIIIQKGNIVLHLDNYAGVMDFNDRQTRELIINRFFSKSSLE